MIVLTQTSKQTDKKVKMMNRSAHVSSVFISLLLLLLLIACCATAVVAAPVASNVAAAAPSELLHLYPETPRVAERLRCGLTQRYRVHDLEPTKVYDVKVSYPASIPTDFILEVDQVLLPVEDPAGNAAAATGTMRVRRLNTAKLRLHPQELLLNALRKNHHSQDQHASNTYQLDLLNGRAKATMDGQQALALERVTLDISLRAQVEGVSPVIDPSTRECVFDIVVEEMLFGGAFPYDTLVLIVWLALLLLMALKWVYPYLLQKIALELPEERVYLGSSGSGGNIKES